MRLILGILCLAMLSVPLGCGGKDERAPATTSGGPSNLPRTTTTTVPPRTADSSGSATSSDDAESLSVSDPDNIYGRTIDEINANSPLQDVPFEYDSAELLEPARAIIDQAPLLPRRWRVCTVAFERSSSISASRICWNSSTVPLSLSCISLRRVRSS